MFFTPKNGFIVSAIRSAVFGNCREGLGGTPGGPGCQLPTFRTPRGRSKSKGALILDRSPNRARNKSNFSKIWCKVPKTPLQSFREAYRSRARGFLHSTMRARIERWRQLDLRCTSAIAARTRFGSLCISQYHLLSSTCKSVAPIVALFGAKGP